MRQDDFLRSLKRRLRLRQLRSRSGAGTRIITSSGGGGFVTPDQLDNVSFELGFDGFTNWAGGAPQTVTRDNVRAFDGTWSLKRAFPNTTGTGDNGAQCVKSFGGGVGFDRMWARFYVYLDARFDGTCKFNIWQDPPLNNQLGGIYFAGGFLQAFTEDTAGSGMAALVDLNTFVGGWHYIEVDFWRNGDTSNGGNDYPSMAIYIDGVQLTSGAFIPAPLSFIGGRLNFGARTKTQKLGVFEVLGLINGSPPSVPNTVVGSTWMDKVSLSSLGRIGP